MCAACRCGVQMRALLAAGMPPALHHTTTLSCTVTLPWTAQITNLINGKVASDRIQRFMEVRRRLVLQLLSRQRCLWRACFTAAELPKHAPA